MLETGSEQELERKSSLRCLAFLQDSCWWSDPLFTDVQSVAKWWLELRNRQPAGDNRVVELPRLRGGLFTVTNREQFLIRFVHFIVSGTVQFLKVLRRDCRKCTFVFHLVRHFLHTFRFLVRRRLKSSACHACLAGTLYCIDGWEERSKKSWVKHSLAGNEVSNYPKQILRMVSFCTDFHTVFGFHHPLPAPSLFRKIAWHWAIVGLMLPREHTVHRSSCKRKRDQS